MSATMAKQKKPEQQQSSKPDPTYTSVRIYTADQVKLSRLAALRGESLAAAYRAVLGPVLDSALLEITERQAQELRREQK